MSRAPTITWVLTICECLFGYWLTTVGYPVTGGLLIGASGAMQWTRLK